MIDKFEVKISEEKISSIKDKIKNYPWDTMPNLSN